MEVIRRRRRGRSRPDGSNGPNVLTESGVVRSDIRSSFRFVFGHGHGVPTTIAFTVVDVRRRKPAGRCRRLRLALRPWARPLDLPPRAQDQGLPQSVHQTGADGIATFTSIYPACYDGRWPRALRGVPEASRRLRRQSDRDVPDSLPEDVSTAVYATEGYEQSVSNLCQVSLESDMVFRDGAELRRRRSRARSTRICRRLTVGVRPLTAATVPASFGRARTGGGVTFDG